LVYGRGEGAEDDFIVFAAGGRADPRPDFVVSPQIHQSPERTFCSHPFPQSCVRRVGVQSITPISLHLFDYYIYSSKLIIPRAKHIFQPHIIQKVCGRFTHHLIDKLQIRALNGPVRNLMISDSPDNLPQLPQA
jgi:hypothetical protein